jgi:hypothetical protein
MGKRSTVLAAALALSACAGEPELRSVSAQSAAILGQYRSEFVRFSTAQNQLNAANAARLRAFERERELRATEIQSRMLTWRLAGDGDALSRYEALTERDAASLIAITDASSVQPAAPPPMRFDATPVEAVIRQLTALQRPRTFPERARDLLGFAVSLRAEYEDALSSATEDAAADATASAEADPVPPRTNPQPQ